MIANTNLHPRDARPNNSYPTRGSRAWTERVLELFDRNCMDDFEELCVLMGAASGHEAEHPPRLNTTSTLD